MYSLKGAEGEQYAVITGCDKKTIPADGTVVIPHTISGYPVKEIGYKAFMYAYEEYEEDGASVVKEMKTVVIPAGVETIGTKAFYSNAGLSEVQFPEGLKTIGEKAFSDSGLVTLTFPETLETIGNEAFNPSGRLREVNFSSGVSSLAKDAFTNCLVLEYINTDETNQYFRSVDGVLYSKDGTTLIKYPPARTIDGAKPADYEIAEGTTTIGDYAFQYACDLKSVSMADTIETIGKSAFEYCNGLQEVTLPSALDIVGENAFNGCEYITTINLPKGLKVLPSDAFAGCKRIAAYNVEDGNANYASDEGVLYDAGFKTLLKYPAQKQDKEFTIPSGVTVISDYAFEKNEWLETLMIPEGVTTVGDYALSTCYELKNIVLPDTLESIGNWAFFSDSQLKSVELPDSLKEIGTYAFYVSGITSIEVPGTVERISEYTFASCQNLEKAVLNKGTKYIDDYAFSGCSRLGELTIPDTVESIMPDILKDAGTLLPEGQPITIIGYIDSAGEAFYKENAEILHLVFERAVMPADQKINVTTSRNCTFGSKPFAIGATAKTPLTYESSNEKVATVSKKGIVTLKGVGTAVITIRARETNYFKAVSAKVKISVKPGKPSLKAKNIKRRKTKIVWSKVAGASGYEIYIKSPGQKKFHKRRTKRAKVKSITHSGLKKGKKYYYKVRAFTKVNGKKVYGPFSKIRKVKIKK